LISKGVFTAAELANLIVEMESESKLQAKSVASPAMTPVSSDSAETV
jgi:hypothetical protein